MAKNEDGTRPWREAMALFDRWLQAAPGEARAALERAAAADPALHVLLASLIEADRAANSQGFLGTGAAALQLTIARGSESAATNAAPGQRLGAWALHELIGQGGMGQVWRATRDDGLYRGQAAVKLLLGASSQSPTAAARFAREGELLARMQHPNIAQLLDAGIGPGGQRYLVLEYVAGERIDRWCDARRLSIDDRLRLFGQVCEAVSYAHAHLVVHRDLKPGNILVSASHPDSTASTTTDSGRVKLLDFGVAKLLDDTGAEGSAELSREAAAGLTPEYAAPEQVQGQPVTTATDVYSLGVLLYVLLSDSRPFSREAAAGNPAALARAIAETTPPRMAQALADRPEAAAVATLRGLPSASALAQRLQGDLETIVAKAMKKSPAERYPTVQALHEDLLRHLRNEPVAAQPDSWRYRSAKFVRRHRGAVLALSALLLSLLAGIAATAWQWRAATLEAQRTRTVVRMLADTFTPLAPDESGKAQVPVIDLLRKGWSEAKTKFAGDPALLAEVARPLGLLLKSSGEMSMAAEALALAREQMLAQGQAGTQPYREVVLELGNALLRLGKDEPARQRFEELIAGPGSGGQAWSVEAVNAQILLAQMERRQGHLAQARTLLERSADIARKQFGATDSKRVLALQELADVAREQGKWDEARSLLAQVDEALRQGTPAESHAARLNRATLDVELGRYVDAQSQLAPLAADMRKLYGETDTYTLYTQTWWAIALFHLGDYASSDEVMASALGAARRSEEADVRFTMQLVKARHLLRRARCDEALPLLREDLAHFEQGGNEGLRPFAERTHMLIGECQLRMHRTAAALATLAGAVERQRALYIGPHLDLWPSLMLLAIARADSGQAEQALRDALESARIAEALLPPGHPDRACVPAMAGQLRQRLTPSPAARAEWLAALDRCALALAPRSDSAAVSVLLHKLPDAGLTPAPAGKSPADPVDTRFVLFNF